MVLFLFPFAAIAFSSPHAATWHRTQRVPAITLNAHHEPSHDTLSEMAANWERDHEQKSAPQSVPTNPIILQSALPLAASFAAAGWALALGVAILSLMPTVSPVDPSTQGSTLLVDMAIAFALAEAIPALNQPDPLRKLSVSSQSVIGSGLDVRSPPMHHGECLLLAEESAADGKAWYLCSSKPDDPSIQCTEDYTGIADADPNAGGHDWLCKVPKAMYA